MFITCSTDKECTDAQSTVDNYMIACEYTFIVIAWHSLLPYDSAVLCFNC